MFEQRAIVGGSRTLGLCLSAFSAILLFAAALIAALQRDGVLAPVLFAIAGALSAGSVVRRWPRNTRSSPSDHTLG
jgi:hypothetical protein